MKRKHSLTLYISAFFVTILVFLFMLPKLEQMFKFAPIPNKEVPLPTMLHPVVADYRDELVERSEEKGIDLVITEGYRSMERQASLYAQGRTEEGAIVTNAEPGESYHNYGLAIDFALGLENGEVVWDMERDGNGNGKSDWMEVVEMAKELGFEWGGDWRGFKDYPHLQMDFGLSIQELKWGFRPNVGPS